MRTEFLKLINQINELDVSKSPNYITMKAIAQHPKAKFPPIVASLIKIDVNDYFINDKDLFDTTINTFVNLINKTIDQLMKDFGPDLPMKMLENMSWDFKLTYQF